MPWIAHPAVDQAPVSWVRYLKYYVSKWMRRIGERWESEALYPDLPCVDCGKPLYRGDHSECDNLPF